MFLGIFIYYALTSDDIPYWVLSFITQQIKYSGFKTELFFEWLM